MDKRGAAGADNEHFARAYATLERWDREPSTMPAIRDTFECHIFATPLDPDVATKQRFVAACEAADIKPLCLGLDYAGAGVVNVLQSTRYYRSDSPREPVAWMLRDAQALARVYSGEIIRLKLEAMAFNPGVPLTDASAAALPGDTYFEFHIKLGGRPVSAESDALLKQLARELTEELEIKVPFSCNNLGDKRQRFLNARTYGLGLPSARARVSRIIDAVTTRGFEVRKVIEEFIVFDTNKALDSGWLEP